MGKGANLFFMLARMIKRGDGRSSVGAAAYRRGEKMEEFEDADPKDPNAAREVKRSWDFSAAQYFERVQSAQIWNSGGRTAEEGWGEIEKIETWKTAQLARELIVSLPMHLPIEIGEALLYEFVEEYIAPLGMMIDATVHKHGRRTEKIDGQHVPIYQPHGHILMATRGTDETGEFEKTKNREWNKRGYLELWREGWQRTLEKHNIKLVNPPMNAYDSQLDEIAADAGREDGGR